MVTRLLAASLRETERAGGTLLERRIKLRRALRQAFRDIAAQGAVRETMYVFPFDDPIDVWIPCQLTRTDMRVYLTDYERLLRPDP